MIIGIDASRANNPQKTGVGWYAYHVIQKLKKIVPPSTSVILYTDKPLIGDLAKLPDNWSQKVLRWPPKRLWTHIRFSFEMFVNKPDVLWVPAHVPPIIHPKKTIMTVHDVAAIKFPNSYSRFERWYTLWSAKYALKKLAHIIVPSKFTESELANLVPKNSNLTTKISVIPHGFDQKYSNPEKPSASGQDKKAIKPYIISIGRLEEKKNTISIIKSFNKIKSQSKFSNLQLLLVGSPGHGFEQVQKEIQSSKYSSDIIHPGWVEQSDLPSLLANAEIFLFPSLYEGFGIPILESFAAGTPVITSHGLSTEEVGGNAAIYVDPQNIDDISKKLSSLLKDKHKQQELIKKGKERIKSFSWENSARETYNVIVGDCN